MREDVKEALENAQTVGIKTEGYGEKRHRSFGMVRSIVYAVVQELPGDMSIAELCDELCIGSSQAGE